MADDPQSSSNGGAAGAAATPNPLPPKTLDSVKDPVKLRSIAGDRKPGKRLDALRLRNFKSWGESQVQGSISNGGKSSPDSSGFGNSPGWGIELTNLSERNFLAVVGPNGSGKSNLMDGLAFVLGLSGRDLRCGSGTGGQSQTSKISSGPASKDGDPNANDLSHSHASNDDDLNLSSAVDEDDDADMSDGNGESQSQSKSQRISQQADLAELIHRKGEESETSSEYLSRRATVELEYICGPGDVQRLRKWFKGFSDSDTRGAAVQDASGGAGASSSSSSSSASISALDAARKRRERDLQKREGGDTRGLDGSDCDSSASDGDTDLELEQTTGNTNTVLKMTRELWFSKSRDEGKKSAPEAESASKTSSKSKSSSKAVQVRLQQRYVVECSGGVFARSGAPAQPGSQSVTLPQHHYLRVLRCIRILSGPQSPKNFIVFQGDIDNLANRQGKDLREFFEKVSGSTKNSLKAKCDLLQKQLAEAEEDARHLFGRKRIFMIEKRKIREVKSTM